MQILPVGLSKMIEYGILNPIFEINLANFTGNDSVQEMRKLLKRRIDDTREHFKNSKILVNLQDMAVAMKRHSDYVYDIASSWPANHPTSESLGSFMRSPWRSFFLSSWELGPRVYAC